MRNNITSRVINGVLNVLVDASDMAMAAGDTVFDVTAALVACATGDSYCGQAQTDLMLMGGLKLNRLFTCQAH